MWLWVLFDMFLVAFAGHDGLKYVKTIRWKSEDYPDYLLFTAPYRLCEFECEDNNNYIKFPINIGKKAVAEYNKLFPRDNLLNNPKPPRTPLNRDFYRKIHTRSTKHWMKRYHNRRGMNMNIRRKREVKNGSCCPDIRMNVPAYITLKKFLSMTELFKTFLP